jgi:hypothetical protein
MIFIFVEAILYPFYCDYGFWDIGRDQIMLLAISQFVFMIDIFAKFFKAVKKEGDDDEYIRSLSKITEHYLSGEFREDLILWLPIGLIGQI